MSKFVDRLKRQTTSGAQPMGFRATETTKPPALLLVLHIPQPKAQAVASTARGNPDALLVDIEKATAAHLREMAGAAGEIPLGCALGKPPTPGEMQQLQDAGCDFMVFEPAVMPLQLWEDIKAGRVLKVDPSLPEGWLRAIDQVEADAVLAGSPPQVGLSLSDLLSYHRLASLITKPILAWVAPDVKSSELQALGEARVAGIVVSHTSEEELHRLRRTIEALPPPRRRPRRLEAVLPPLPGMPGPTEEEEEEIEQI
ncbi:MAG TPA: hypothetical protein G4O03_00950 [Dehalococcoidia bacterium]|nr:hypothetical protein [Dehalococcoidia bacterium]